MLLGAISLSSTIFRNFIPITTVQFSTVTIDPNGLKVNSVAQKKYVDSKPDLTNLKSESNKLGFQNHMFSENHQNSLLVEAYRAVLGPFSADRKYLPWTIQTSMSSFESDSAQNRLIFVASACYERLKEFP